VLLKGTIVCVLLVLIFKVDHKMVIGISRHMYDIITANYAALFRESSPLHIDWRVKGNFDLIGRSDVLREAFEKLRSEFYQFCELTPLRLTWLICTEYSTDKSSEEFVSEDDLLKRLVIDREMGLIAGGPSKL
jgi:hypothetical protein